MKKKLVIQVYGGLVQAVYSNIPDLALEIFDFDDTDSPKQEMERKERIFKKAVNGLNEI